MDPNIVNYVENKYAVKARTKAGEVVYIDVFASNESQAKFVAISKMETRGTILAVKPISLQP